MTEREDTMSQAERTIERESYEYWYISEAANTAIDRAMAADPLRWWDPRGDSPSLATLQGRAKDYACHYERSRDRLLDEAGVSIRETYAGIGRRRIWLATMPGESLEATGAPHSLLEMLPPSPEELA